MPQNFWTRQNHEYKNVGTDLKFIVLPTLLGSFFPSRKMVPSIFQISIS